MKAIIFDMDGTLTDSEKDWTLSTLRLLERQGIPEERGMAAPWFVPSCGAAMKNYLASPECRLSWDLETCQNWCKNYMYNEIYPKGVPLKPQALETLETVRELKIPACLLSATEKQALHYTLYKLNLLPYFVFWESTCNQPVNKHHVELFERSARRMGVETSDCVVIEDSLYSMKTAKRAGCRVWAIADDKHAADRETIRALADRYFENHVEMCRALRENFFTD